MSDRDAAVLQCSRSPQDFLGAYSAGEHGDIVAGCVGVLPLEAVAHQTLLPVERRALEKLETTVVDHHGEAVELPWLGAAAA